MRKIIIILILLGVSFTLSCSDDKPTAPVEYVDISGIVFVKQNGYTGNISGAQVQIGEYTTVTDSVGRYSLTIPKGTYNITAQHPLYGTRTYEAINCNISKYFTLSLLSDLFDVSGVIYGLENEPMAGVVVSIQDHRDTTNSEGEYLFEDVPQGLWILQCAHLDYDPVYDSVYVEQENSIHNLNLTRIRVAVSGNISNDDNEPVANAEVKFDDTLSVYSDNNGDYIFPSVGPGVHYISCEVYGYGKIIESIYIVENDINLNISLTRNLFQVSGTLRGVNNETLYWVTVIINDTLGASTNSDGLFTFPAVLGGTVIVRCDYKNYNLYLDTITISGDTVLEDIRLNKDGYSVSGKLSHVVEGPVAGLEVSINDSYFDTTDADGYFLLEGVLAGDYRLEINSPTYYAVQSLEFTLPKADFQKDYILKISVIDTLWITEDACIKDHSDYSNFVNTNFGDEETISLTNYFALYRDNINGITDIEWDNVDLYLEIPALPDINADSIMLEMIVKNTLYNGEALNYGAYPVLSEWDEMEITTHNQPELASDRLLFSKPDRFDEHWRINISGWRSSIDNDYGFKIVDFGYDPIVVLFGIEFYSSEYPDASKRPKVLIYNSY